MTGIAEALGNTDQQVSGRKYHPIGTPIIYQGRRLRQIKALRDMPEIGVRAGDLGGYVQGYRNLSHDGLCWVFEGGRVFDRARILENAQVRDHARVYDCAQLAGNTRVRDYAQVYGDACLIGDAQARDHAQVYDSAQLSGQAEALDHAQVYGKANLTGYAKARDHARVYDDATLSDHAQACDHSQVMGQSQIRGLARIYGYDWVYGDQIISGDTWRYAESQVTGSAPQAAEPKEPLDWWRLMDDPEYCREYQRKQLEKFRRRQYEQRAVGGRERCLRPSYGPGTGD